eukprot:TRINITY_DN3090_c1_g1_i4.p1 TRINITY_DN3090_c1_g1~~TRINITY_DN3090_c1_g1_i4.p1  ORF type:complete len:1078 (-),score=292.41 TRINITY_DN3090_c1_g1_i4:67-3300(-)
MYIQGVSISLCFCVLVCLWITLDLPSPSKTYAPPHCPRHFVMYSHTIPLCPCPASLSLSLSYMYVYVQVNDLRSKAVSVACELVVAVAKRLGTSYGSFASVLIPDVWNQRVAGGVMATAVHHMLADVACASIPRKLISQLPKHMKACKSAELRYTQMNIVYALLDAWQAPDLENIAKYIAMCIKLGLPDSAADSRQLARQAYWRFHALFPAEATQLLSSLNAKTQTLISDDQHKGYQSKIKRHSPPAATTSISGLRTTSSAPSVTANSSTSSGTNAKKKVMRTQSSGYGRVGAVGTKPSTPSGPSRTLLSGGPARRAGSSGTVAGTPASSTATAPTGTTTTTTTTTTTSASASASASATTTTTTTSSGTASNKPSSIAMRSLPSARDPFTTGRSTVKTPRAKLASGPMAVKRSPSAPAAAQIPMRPSAEDKNSSFPAAESKTATAKTPGRAGRSHSGKTPARAGRTPLGSARRSKGQLGSTPAQRVIRSTSADNLDSAAAAADATSARLNFGGADSGDANNGSATTTTANAANAAAPVTKDDEDLQEMMSELLTTKTDWQKRRDTLLKLATLLCRVDVADADTVAYVLGPRMRKLLIVQLSDKRPGMVKAAKEFTATLLDHFTVARTQSLEVLDQLGTYLVPKLVRVVSEAATKTLGNIVQAVMVNIVSACVVDDKVIDMLWSQFKVSRTNPARSSDLADTIGTLMTNRAVLTRTKMGKELLAFLKYALKKEPVLGSRTEDAFWAAQQVWPSECNAILEGVSSSARENIMMCKPADAVPAPAVVDSSSSSSENIEETPTTTTTATTASAETAAPVAVPVASEPAVPATEAEPVAADVIAPVVSAPVPEPSESAPEIVTVSGIPPQADETPAPLPQKKAASPSQQKKAASPSPQKKAAASPATSTTPAKRVSPFKRVSPAAKPGAASVSTPHKASPAPTPAVARAAPSPTTVVLQNSSVKDLITVASDVHAQVKHRMHALALLFTRLQDNVQGSDDDDDDVSGEEIERFVVALFVDAQSQVRYVARVLFWLFTEKNPERGYALMSTFSNALQSILRNEHSRMLAVHGRIIMPSMGITA